MVKPEAMPVFFPPPAFRSAPSGEIISFAALCAAARMKMVVSGRQPDIRLHGEAVDFKAVAPGRAAYCFGLPLLPTDARARARTMMNKLAYQFMNWAAREVVRADRARSTRRYSEARAKTLRHALAPNAARILSFLQEAHAARVSDVAAKLAIAQPHASRALGSLLAAGLVRRHKRGREVIFEIANDAWSPV